MDDAVPRHGGFQLVYMPYLGFRTQETIRFGRVELVNADRVVGEIESADLQSRIRALLSMHRVGPDGRRPAAPIENMGILTPGGLDFQALSAHEQAAVHDLRCALFLSCLATTTRLKGPNAAHFAFTAENFRIITQEFDLQNDRIAEVAGVLVTQTMMGYKVAEHRFPKPSYVHIPIGFNFDDRLFGQLQWLRHHSATLLRRILRATAVFLESFYNTPAVDVNARLLLQASAFEILLDLPDKQPRKHFKDEIERLCCTDLERTFRYTFETPKGRVAESRTSKGVWADRFYTLRNHIIHGHVVPRAEYLFRDVQHHLTIAPLMFVLCSEQLINSTRIQRGKQPQLFDRLTWLSKGQGHDDNADETASGFRLEYDWGALFAAQLRKHPRLRQ